MQRIYATGIGDIQTEDEWLVIKKEENFRCPTSVLAVANAIRRDGDGLQQVRGRTTRVDGVDVPVPGTARIFVLPADEQRSERLLQVRQWIAEANHDPAWRAGESADLKVLLIVHRMAATRLGFANLYAAMNDDAPEAFKAGLLEGTAWPLRPFLAFVLPLCSALRDEAQFKAMSILREQCPRLARSALTSADTEDVLQAIRQSTGELASMMAAESTATNRQVLQLLREANLVALDPRLLSYLEEAPPPADDAPDDDAEATLEAGAMDRFLACAAREFWGYSEYMNRESPFVTQQGIKGAEFPKVLVVLDDDEGTHVQFSYDKYFGIKPLSQRDQENLREGKETAVERTRRLFYVCCTRALTDLAVVLFSSDVTLAEERVRALSIFPNDQVLTLAAIENSPVQ
jgi:DNA helicase-2/ATP-dependent DNA helicase PcrA